MNGITKDIFKTKQFATFNDKEIRMYFGIRLMANEWGRLKDEPIEIKTTVFPYGLKVDSEQLHLFPAHDLEMAIITDIITKMEQVNLVKRYQVNNHRYIQLLGVKTPYRARPSKIPPMPGLEDKLAEPRKSVLFEDDGTPATESEKKIIEVLNKLTGKVWIGRECLCWIRAVVKETGLNMLDMLNDLQLKNWLADNRVPKNWKNFLHNWAKNTIKFRKNNNKDVGAKSKDEYFTGKWKKVQGAPL